MTMQDRWRSLAMPMVVVALTCAAALYAAKAEGYAPFVLAMVALTAIVGVGLNILVGLTGQISLGHVGFYAIGGYTVAILTLQGLSFWIALPLAALLAGAIGLLLSLPAVRDAEIAARSIGLNPVGIKAAAFMLSASFAGIAGGIFASLLAFVAPDSFPFSQSILFLLACVVGGAGWVLGPAVGAAVTVILPELLSSLAEYRLLFFGILLLVVLWLAPEGILGSIARLFRRIDPRRASAGDFDAASFLAPGVGSGPLEVRELGISFGGIKAASGVSFSAAPGKVTSVIGPNGAGKTTVLNIIGGFYRPDLGSIRLGGIELAGAPAWKVARAGIARTYQTTKLFETMSVLDNVLIAMRRGRLGSMLSAAAGDTERRVADGLLSFVGYRDALARPAAA